MEVYQPEAIMLQALLFSNLLLMIKAAATGDGGVPAGGHRAAGSALLKLVVDD
jgi:hypothetical protein